MVAAWNQTHPKAKATGQEIPAVKTSEEVIGASITAGNAPCLVFNTSPAAVPGSRSRAGSSRSTTCREASSTWRAGPSGGEAVPAAGRQVLTAALEVQPGDDLLQEATQEGQRESGSSAAGHRLDRSRKSL
jgi:hypothetical protein